MGLRKTIWVFTVVTALVLGLPLLPWAAGKPVHIGLDAEFGYANSTSAEAIRQGILIAVEEINRGGGVLGGRPLVLESLPTIHAMGLPLLDPWGAADAIIDNGYRPNHAFRLSLRDGWAIPVMMRHARKKGADRVGMLLLNTSWGRGSLKAAESHVAKNPPMRITVTHWFNWNDKSLLDKYQSIRRSGARALILVANATEAAILIKEVAGLPAGICWRSLTT